MRYTDWPGVVGRKLGPKRQFVVEIVIEFLALTFKMLPKFLYTKITWMVERASTLYLRNILVLGNFKPDMVPYDDVSLIS